MTPETLPPARITLLRVATVTWLMLISGAVIINHVTLSKVVDLSAQKASNTQVTALDEQVRKLIAWVEEQDQQQSIALPVARYESDRQSLDQRLIVIEQMLDQKLAAQDLDELQRRIELLETRPAIVQPAPKGAARPRTPPPPKPVEPPFQVIGIERRGDERFLSLLPIGSTALSQALLVRPGETQADWQLKTIEGNNAVFQKGSQIHRLVIPQQVRP